MPEKVIKVLCALLVCIVYFAPATALDPATPFLITGETFDSASAALDDCIITVENINTNEIRTAKTTQTSNYYQFLISNVNVSSGDTLRIIAKHVLEDGYTTPQNYTYCINITTVEIIQDDINMGGLSGLDLTLNHFCINYYPDYPYFTQEEWNYSGAAVMKMWTEFKQEGPYTQDALQIMGHSNNTGGSDPYCIDPHGMADTLNHLLPSNHFSVGVHENTTEGLERALHRICWWQYLGPGSLPVYGNPSPEGYYEFWMGIRGIHTDMNPHDGTYSAPYGYDVYGFWVNDPNALTAGCIGENSYKTAQEWTQTYYKPTYDPRIPEWNDKYITVLEPPEDDANINIVPAKPRFDDAVEPVKIDQVLSDNSAMDNVQFDAKFSAFAKNNHRAFAKDTNRAIVEDIAKNDVLNLVKAAKTGVNEELVPFDTQFAQIFAKTHPGKPMFVSGTNGDYCIVPFNMQLKHEIKPVQTPVYFDKQRTLVVVLIDAQDGHFKEASWVNEPMKYLPVSQKEALELVFEEIELNTKKDKPIIKLVQSLSPYYPDWKITIGDRVFYVSQGGIVTPDKPAPPDGLVIEDVK